MLTESTREAWTSPTGAMAELLRVDVEEWRAQLPQFREYCAKFENLPAELTAQLDALEQRLG